jgi:hypothetical protein
MEEIVVNLHMHTTYSDGSGSHAEIARSAMRAGLDAVITTDHNIWISGPEGYYQEGNRKVLVLVGEEIHDQARDPQKNHMLVFGAGRELSQFASRPQLLIDQVRNSKGLSFLAHPIDPALPAFGEDDISWVDWNIHGFTGIELWNGFSELKTVIKGYPQAIFYAFNPAYIAHGPLPKTLEIWDSLTNQGKKVVAIGGSDAHALTKTLGPLKRVLFPYDFHFKAVNTHLLLQNGLTGRIEEDKSAIYDAFRKGHVFVGNDLPASTKGFRFSATGRNCTAWMGDEINHEGGVTLQVHFPRIADCRLIKNGKMIKNWLHRDNYTHITSEPGVYRVEAEIDAYGKRRGWIYSNPIYIL